MGAPASDSPVAATIAVAAMARGVNVVDIKRPFSSRSFGALERHSMRTAARIGRIPVTFITSAQKQRAGAESLETQAIPRLLEALF
jgi:hypothetical protein